jgi:hypothetical protein
MGGANSGLLLNRLCSLGYIDATYGGQMRWQICRPSLFLSTPNAGMFTGARTPAILELLTNHADRMGCTVAMDIENEAPTSVTVEGELEELRSLASSAGVDFIEDPLGHFCKCVKPMWRLLDTAPRESAPINWVTRSFSLSTLTWTEGLLPKSACEFTSHF